MVLSPGGPRGDHLFSFDPRCSPALHLSSSGYLSLPSDFLESEWIGRTTMGASDPEWSSVPDCSACWGCWDFIGSRWCQRRARHGFEGMPRDSCAFPCSRKQLSMHDARVSMPEECRFEGVEEAPVEADSFVRRAFWVWTATFAIALQFACHGRPTSQAGTLDSRSAFDAVLSSSADLPALSSQNSSFIAPHALNCALFFSWVHSYDLLCMEGLARGFRMFLGLDKPPAYRLSTRATVREVQVEPAVSRREPEWATVL